MIGLPGERVRSAGGGLEVDGAAVPEPYLAGPPPRLDELGPAEYLVLGDHRAASTDGRDFGPAPTPSAGSFAYWPPRRLRRRG